MTRVQPISGRPVHRLRAALLTAVLLTPVLLLTVSGCGALSSYDDETSHEGTSENGVNWTQAGLRIDDAYVVLDGGDSARLHVTLYNGGAEPDALVAVVGAGASASASAGGAKLPLKLPPDSTVLLDEQHQALDVPLPSPPPPAGADLPVTLTFERAGATTRDLPIITSQP